jgi:hypothetical protein
MSEKRFDIVVQDKVARTIKTELAGIGTAARTARGDLNQLYTAMGAQASSAAAQAQAAATRTAAATARVSAEQSKASIQAARLAEAQSKANIAYLNEEAALNRAIAAENRAIQSKQRLAQASTASAAAQQREIRISEAGVVAGSGSQYPFGQYAGSKATAARQTQIMRGTVVGAAEGGAASAVTKTVVADAAALTAAQARVSAGYKALSHDVMGNTLVMRESLVVGRELLSGNLTRLPGSLSIIGQQFAVSGKSASGFFATVLSSLGIIKRSGDVALDAAAAQAKAVADIVAGNLAAAETAAATAAAEIELAEAQQAAATTATARAAAAARLTAATEAQAAADAEAVVAADALASAQGAVAETSTAAAAATRTGLGAIGRILVPVGIAIGALTIGLGALKHEANDDSGLRHFTKSMGYTAAEVEKLNAVTVSWGDTAKAVFEVGFERLASVFGLNTKQMASAWGSALNWMASTTREVMADIYAAVAGMVYGVHEIVAHMNDGKSNDNPITNMVNGFREAHADAQHFFDDVVKKARGNAKARQDAMASTMYNKPHEKKEPKGWDRAKALREDNAELDAQISLLGLYGDALERANQLEQLSKKYREHNVPLTEKETAALRAKLQTIQDGKRVQEAMTAAEEAAHGPGRKLDDMVTALNKLLADGAISQEDYTNQMNLATRAYEDAVDPLAALNRELQRNGELMGLYGRSKDVASYIQQLQQAAEAQGKSIYQRSSGPAANDNGTAVVTGRRKRLTNEAQTMVDQFKQQQKQEQYGQAMEAIDPREKQKPGDLSYILDHHKELYAEIDRMRQADVLSEQDAAERKQNLDRAYLDARLDATSNMLGQLASLQSSHSRTVAAIGKAAAMAQATIDGYRAVQAALAGPPGPPWSFAIAGVTAAMTAVNVARIAGVGFQAGGYTGDMGTSTVAGAVHGQEYVFDAAATRRIGVPALEALRNGSRLGQPGNDNSARHGNIRIVQGPGTYVEAAERSDGEIEIIAERVARRVAPGAVAQDIRHSPNSPTSKAMRDSFGVRRNR